MKGVVGYFQLEIQRENEKWLAYRLPATWTNVVCHWSSTVFHAFHQVVHGNSKYRNLHTHMTIADDFSGTSTFDFEIDCVEVEHISSNFSLSPLGGHVPF